MSFVLVTSDNRVDLSSETSKMGNGSSASKQNGTLKETIGDHEESINCTKDQVLIDTVLLILYLLQVWHYQRMEACKFGGSSFDASCHESNI